MARVGDAAPGVRIVAGAWRGRRLMVPAGATTRPTGERMREALFSMLTSRLGSFEGLVVLDLFAGSGALGLEALSRGAAGALFVDQAPDAVAALRHNIATLGAQPCAVILPQPVSTLGAPPCAHDLVFCDAPYDSGAGQVALDRLLRLGWIAPSAWVALELAAREPLDARAFVLDTERRHGKGRIALLRPAPV